MRGGNRAQLTASPIGPGFMKSTVFCQNPCRVQSCRGVSEAAGGPLPRIPAAPYFPRAQMDEWDSSKNNDFVILCGLECAGEETKLAFLTTFFATILSTTLSWTWRLSTNQRFISVDLGGAGAWGLSAGRPPLLM